MNEPVRKPLDTVAVVSGLALCLIWGLQQTAIKAAAGDISPMLQVAVRSGVSGLLILVAARLILHEKWNPEVKFFDMVLFGLGFVAEFFFVSEGLRFTSAAHMSVLLYTAPLFAAVGLSVKFPEERLALIQWLGVLVAFLGIATAFLLPALMAGESAGDNVWIGDLLGLCSGLSWGMSTVFLRNSSINKATSTQMLFCQLAAGFIVLFPVALLTGQNHFESTLIGWASLLYQTFIVSFASYLAWFLLLRRSYFSHADFRGTFRHPAFGGRRGLALCRRQPHGSRRFDPRAALAAAALTCFRIIGLFQLFIGIFIHACHPGSALCPRTARLRGRHR